MARPLLVIVGPTAMGKTALSVQLAAAFEGEIVSADSRLFYRGMDIGTAKPAAGERARIPHHLIDICRPDETLTLGEYQRLAKAAIDDIQRRGRLPILVGGTGQYMKAVMEGWGIPEVAPQRRLRQALAALGGPEVARWLARLDPEAAGKIDRRNVRRVIRALEVTLLTGRPISKLQRKHPPPYAILTIGLTCDREALYARIDTRVEQMMAGGLLEEVKALRAAGYGRRLPAMSGLGYRQLWAYLEGECTLAEAVERIRFETHRFARQQYTWFRPGDEGVVWFDVTREGWEGEVVRVVRDWRLEIGDW
ncbi:MAG: tRNA (adenosine(37)-N6)-dimethylallyltransferase MiaA [Chloroflexi bacterium]|nr:tRNA (adenosine(37)-N6)-dimethylallyltransferase MiaA [Chloroflexota bacterium]MCI0650156.1 tRNA (adenosine(37)-N6)-dimethylallyltransferase MiaA [Chloroflexota bacterium]MCI0728011.1 tRNA (adenosine(37)-N6)-dimethylallyltransferase MiaA [Chloroflexota bacterium]